MKVPNLNGLGANQRQTLQFLKDGCVLVHVENHSDNSQCFSIEDEFDVFKEISLIEFNSLIERNLISSFSTIEKSVNLTHTIYKINSAFCIGFDS